MIPAFFGTIYPESIASAATSSYVLGAKCTRVRVHLILCYTYILTPLLASCIMGNLETDTEHHASLEAQFSRQDVDLRHYGGGLPGLSAAGF